MTVSELRNLISPLIEQRNLLNDQIRELNDKIKEVVELDAGSRPITFAESLEVYKDGVECRTYRKALDKYIKALNAKLSENTRINNSFGYNEKTKQYEIEIVINKSASDEDLIALSNVLLNHVLPHTKSYESKLEIDEFKGLIKCLPISEYSLCEDGVYNVIQNGKGGFAILLTRYHRNSLVYQSNSLVNVLKEIRQHYWYQ